MMFYVLGYDPTKEGHVMLMTSKGFASYDAAKVYRDSVSPSYSAFIVGQV